MKGVFLSNFTTFLVRLRNENRLISRTGSEHHRAVRTRYRYRNRNRLPSGLVESHALGGSLEFCLGLFQPLSLNHWHRQLPVRFCEPQGQHHVHSSRFGANKALKSSILHVDAPKLFFSWVLEDVVQVLACRLNRLLRRNVSDVEVFITGFRLIPYITITLFAGLGVAGSLRRAKMRSRSLEPSSILRPL